MVKGISRALPLLCHSTTLFLKLLCSPPPRARLLGPTFSSFPILYPSSPPLSTLPLWPHSPFPPWNANQTKLNWG